MSLTHKVSDLFHTDWQHLKADAASIVLSMHHHIDELRRQERFDELGAQMRRVLLLISRQPEIFKKLTAEQIVDIFHDIDLFNKLWYTFHITYIRTKADKLLPPDEKLADFTFNQLKWADAEYSKFLVLADREDNTAGHHLNRLIAVLYSPSVSPRSVSHRPEKQPFSEDQMEKYANQLPKGLTFQMKYLILRTYGNCRSFIIQRCPHLFPSSGSEKNTPGKPQYTGQMWAELLYDLSDTPAFSGYERAANTNIYTALDYLDKKAREAKELRERRNQHA